MILTFKTNVPLELTMPFEACYEPELQMSIEDKKEVCKIAAWLYVDGVMAGEIYGCAIKDMAEDFDEGQEIFEESLDSIYCYSVTLLPEFRGKGLGSIMHAYWMGLCKGLPIIGHATSNEMWKLASKFGATFFNRHENWYGTKRTSYFYKIHTQ